MTKYLTVVLLTLYFFHFSCYAKETNDSLKIKSKKFSFAIYAGGVYSFPHFTQRTRTLNLSNTPDEDYHLVSFPSSREKGVTTINTGFYFEFRLRKNVFLNIGLNYTQTVYETKDNTTFYLAFHGNASPYTYYDTTTNLKIKNSYYFISVPICLYYRLNCKKSYYSFGGGASISAYRTSTIETAGLQYGATQTEYDKTIGLMGTLFARIGVFHSLGKKMLIGFEPEFKYYITYPNLFTLGGNLVLKF